MPMDLPPDYDAFKGEIISDQNDDDQGVYEVWWRANVRYPTLHVSTRLAIAETVVRDLLREGRIAPVQREWATLGGEQTPVDDPDATLLNWATWVLPPNEPVVWMVDA